MAMLTTLLLLSAVFALGDARGSRGHRHNHCDSEEHIPPPPPTDYSDSDEHIPPPPTDYSDSDEHIHPPTDWSDSKEHIHPPKDRSDSKEHIHPPKDRSDSKEHIHPPRDRSDSKEHIHPPKDLSDSEENIPPRKEWHRRVCPNGWPRYKTHCYHYVPFMTTWPEAERKCLRLGGNLASVHSLPQYRFLQSVIRKSTRKVQRTWIGANDAIKEGLWLWSDGSRFNYQNWGPGQPSNYNHGVIKDNTNGREHCMEMNYGASRCQNDAPCWFTFPFLCSRKL
ncbi:lithostathine-1-like [Oncorhynchus tshawytscha]|uniref:lithostathine-1-like n=1 Tax=Oncorhynchus tshawytscha TaxID=74940 RepID=UPI001C3C82F9|nr:lithostathine-1-like [Oncorhynchus tshawytscha]